MQQTDLTTHLQPIYENCRGQALMAFMALRGLLFSWSGRLRAFRSFAIGPRLFGALQESAIMAQTLLHHIASESDITLS